MKTTQFRKSRAARFLLVRLQIFPLLVVLLFLAYQIAGIIKSFPLGHTTAITQYSTKQLQGYKTTGQLQGDIARGTFTADEDNLGIVLVRFFNYYHISNDSMKFRVKEQGSTDWYHQTIHTVNQFQPDKYFTFGFPEIANAKNKTYVFEIESIKGKKGDAIGLSEKKPVFAATYRYDLGRLKSDIPYLAKFAYKKWLYAMYQADYAILLKTYLLALFLSTVWHKRSFFLYANNGNAGKYIRSPLLKRIYTSIFAKPQKDEVTIADFYYYYNVLFEKSGKVVKAARKLGQKIWFYVEKPLAKMQPYLPFIAPVVIFVLALLLRLEFYYDPKNYVANIMSSIGGTGDYDDMFRRTWRLLWSGKLLADTDYFFNDNVFLSRIQGFLLSRFGYIAGLHYTIILFCFVGAFVSLVPYFITTKLKRQFSVGGFVASLLLATNPMFIWLSTARIIDAGTSFTYSFFIIFFMLALWKRNYWFAVLAGLVGFIDGINRGMMFFSNWPSLILFALYTVASSAIWNRKFPYITLHARGKDASVTGKGQKKRKTDVTVVGRAKRLYANYGYVVYAFTPVVVFTALYFIVNAYYTFTFQQEWAFGPGRVVTRFNPFVDADKVLAGGGHFYDKPINLLALSTTMFSNILDVTSVPIIFLIILIILLFLLFRRFEKQLFLLGLLLILLYLGSLAALQKSILPALGTDALSYTARGFYLLKLNQYELLGLVWVLALAMALLLKWKFFHYMLILIPYLIVLSYGLEVSFSDRHFTPVVLLFFIVLAVTFDALWRKVVSLQNPTWKIVVALYFIGIITTVSVGAGGKVSRLVNHYIYYVAQKEYLTYAKSIIPQDGIILVGMRGENVYWIQQYTQRMIMFNTNLTGALTFPYKKGYHKVNYNDYDLSWSNSLKYPAMFREHKYYVLDYADWRWKQIVYEKDFGNSSVKHGVYDLILVNPNSNKRPIYQLVLKETAP